MSRRSVSFRLLLLPLVLVLAACGGRTPVAAGPGTGGTIQVTVTSAAGSASGAQVSLHDANDQDVQDGTTDSGGQYSFTNVSVGRTYRVIASLNGISGTADNLVVHDTTPVTAQIPLAGGGANGALTGTVEVSGRQYGIPGATVKVDGTAISATTDRDGRFQLIGVPPGEQHVIAQAPGYNSQDRDLAVKPGQSNILVFDLQPLSAGPRAGHTIVSVGDKVVEYDQWHNPVGSYKASHAAMAVVEPQSGNILVTDTDGSDVIDYAPGGSVSARFTGTAWYKLEMGGLARPMGATRAANGNVAVADTGNNRVVELDSSNHKVWEYGSGLSAPGSAQRLPNGDMLICDSGNNRVIELSGGNSIVWAVGDGGSLLSHPTSAFRIPDSAPGGLRGNTLVCDSGNNRVMVVVSQPGTGSQGQYVWMIGGAQPLQDPIPTLSSPSGATYLANGDVLIADTGNNRVIEVAPNNSVVWKLPVAAPVFADRL